MRTSLESNHNVIVDRCNFDVSQRETWLRIAKEYGASVYCVVLTTTSTECSDRISYRVNHPTGVEGRQGVAILRRFTKNYQPPTDTSPEGFQSLVYLSPSPNTFCTQERVDSVLKSLGIIEPVDRTIVPKELLSQFKKMEVTTSQEEHVDAKSNPRQGANKEELAAEP
ncbi:hypothetical protein CLU79DRAFT_693349 [Phycomyces nitens]|nr:hypothetical protein CLU79DRAFT_693349 [Phycomyces nitens]